MSGIAWAAVAIAAAALLWFLMRPSARRLPLPQEEDGRGDAADDKPEDGRVSFSFSLPV